MKKTVGLIYNAGKKENSRLVKKVAKYLSDKNIKICICKTGIKTSEWHKLKGKIHLAIILGGDGTLLATSRVLAAKGIPIFGINTGHLGFLTEGKEAGAIELVEKILSGEGKIDERSMLCSYIIGKRKKEGPFYALNDVVITRGTSRKMVNMTLNVNKKPAADYIADGLIICTPTGSTAYALSAGGAVMEPAIEGIEIVPICAHTLTSRPHIVSDKKEIIITFNRPHKGTTIQLDGQESFQIKDDTKVLVTRSKYKAKLIRLPSIENDFYWRIRRKFHWGIPTTL